MNLFMFFKLLNLCFSHLLNEDNNSVYLLGLLWELNEVRYEKHIAAQSRFLQSALFFKVSELYHALRIFTSFVIVMNYNNYI